MAREIKFRALSMCKGERWVYGDLRHYARNPHTEKWTIHDPATGLETDIDETTIGQYTGMLDRNGKEVYEGDILEVYFPVWDRNRRKNVIVEYDDTCVGFKFRLQDTANEYLYFKNDDVTLAVVGNIHDNNQ